MPSLIVMNASTGESARHPPPMGRRSAEIGAALAWAQRRFVSACALWPAGGPCHEPCISGLCRVPKQGSRRASLGTRRASAGAAEGVPVGVARRGRALVAQRAREAIARGIARQRASARRENRGCRTRA
jgi:hypothetical protein